MTASKKWKMGRRQTAVKGRSSAFIITVTVHVVLFLLAGTYVAMEVAQRQEAKFEGRQVVRPKIKLKKLQVPVKTEVQVKQQAPQMSQRLTASRLDTKAMDFKMPEIAGFGGTGFGNGGSGSGLGGSLGFATTQVNVFGLRSSGEKIVFVLDSSDGMMSDQIGGIPAYNVIKQEISRIVGKMPPTTLFGLVVVIGNAARAFSDTLVPASDENLQKLKAWLAPLNSSRQEWGINTLNRPWFDQKFEPMKPIYSTQGGWAPGLSYALRNRADCIYVLGQLDGLSNMQKELWDACNKGAPLEFPGGWDPQYNKEIDYGPVGGIEAWKKLEAQARQLYDEDNKRRLAKGLPVRVLPANALVSTYMPNVPKPQLKSLKGTPTPYVFTADNVIDYIENMNEKYAGDDKRSFAVGLKNKKLPAVNVIYFVPKSSDVRDMVLLPQVANKTKGSYLRLQGLDAIKSASIQAEKE